MDETKLLSVLGQSENAEERRNAAQAIVSVETFSKDSLTALANGLHDPDIGVRDICFLGLLNVPDEIKPDSAKSVAELISSDDIEVRNLAGDLLIQLGRYSAKALVPFLENDDTAIFKYACDILGIIDATDIIDNIYPLLRNYDANVRASAVEALGNLGDTKALKHLFGIYDIDESIQPNVIESIGKIGQNIKYDIVVLLNYGVQLRGVAFDTMIAAHLLDSERRRYSMAALAADMLGHHMTPISDLIGKGKDQKRMDEVPVAAVGPYAAEDADIPLRLEPLLAARLEESNLRTLFDRSEEHTSELQSH